MNHDNEVLVRVEGVSKVFCRDFKKSLLYGLQDSAKDLLSWGRKGEVLKEARADDAKGPDVAFDRSLRQGEFLAVNHVSFELKRGECLGLIGRNGAGKTTLLKMLNGLIKPDAGRIEMRGRIGALIALGSGFNPILSGRENIYVNGSVLGLSREEIDEKVEGIIDFAEIRDFIDAPVQTYSSGMQVRLGFAVATTMEPDILILDEVLAVGDAAFRAKCYNRIVSLRKKAAVIFVSHAMEQVARICDSVLLLSKGSTVCLGNPAKGIQRYEELNEMGDEQDQSFLQLLPPLLDFKPLEINHPIESGAPLQLRLQVTSSSDLSDFKLRICFYSVHGAIVAEVNQDSKEHKMVIRKGMQEMQVTLQCLPLRKGNYSLGWGIIDSFGDLAVWSYKQQKINVKGSEIGANVECQIPVVDWSSS